LILLLTEGQVSDYRGAATVLPDLPDADVLIADKGHDSDWFREALTDLKITPCIPGRANRKAPIPYDADLYKQRNRIERMFGRLKLLATHRHPTRPLRPHLHERHLHRSYRHLLVVSPEPRLGTHTTY
jgi:transposase